jgi:hypothetical protein
MTIIESKIIAILRSLMLIVLTFQLSSCLRQAKEQPVNDRTAKGITNQSINLKKAQRFRKFIPI